ncbi:Crp/Fnr family transcriptional regulator [Paenibacillus chitinolyticus]|uniref:Crp/Fnr family transcriptional regulator n=1 Tax=Paenibacillus chitinolyticus TaxID=79263 RepID=A0A410WVL1_9BACL|nr:Crp/Fnr family transcriptional regulator [Paenibacillus chitinolyticus]MCY9589226.1 Crp/Fnr family transcriptional regulator [Paenibacillus chitinolyticus]MCY9594299.1 Crp/Fnr family transcriptional regulator [Paenibacillus chitinolyticus]QAV18448.1 Crp/Fnr family transcriptional regulator [Paenibacillus chitinolyticus]
MILHKGEVLFRQGEQGPLFRIRSGLFKVVRLQENGEQFLFNILNPGELIPHHSLLTPKEYHGTAIALITSEVEVIPAAQWYAGLEENPLRYRDAALVLQDKLRAMQQRIDQLTALTPARKIELLGQWFARYVGDIPLSDVLTQEEIGQLVGLRRETVNRLLRKQR